MKTYMFTAFKIDKNKQGKEVISGYNPYLEKEILADNEEAARSDEGIQLLLKEHPENNINEYTTHISLI